MKLLQHTSQGWQFHLTRIEANYLRHLVCEMFPFGEPVPAKMSAKDKNREAAEREKLLNESLAEHRKNLKQFAAEFFASRKWEKVEDGQLLSLGVDSREMLFQILNDVRVGCWQALGEPESPELLPLPDPGSTPQETGWRFAMELAGYFECALLEPEE